MKVYKRNGNKSYYISFFINLFLTVAICLLLTSCEAGQRNMDAVNIKEKKAVKENESPEDIEYDRKEIEYNRDAVDYDIEDIPALARYCYELLAALIR